MEITEMIKLAHEGVKATDVLALNKAGYTPEIIEELKNNGMQSEEVKAQAEEQQQRQLAAEEKAKETIAENTELSDALKAAQAEIATLKEQIASIQADNRGSDMEGDLPSPEEYKKNLSDYIASKM